MKSLQELEQIREYGRRLLGEKARSVQKVDLMTIGGEDTYQ
ncbi:hypothetical protein [Paraburkholderia caledonica]|nr:hypothetical protein [Paraburkholderia caledonica]